MNKSLRKRCKTGLFFLMAGTIGVQAGDIKGVVFDKELNEPLMGASVRILGTHLGTTADLNGQFKLQGLKKGTYTIEVSYVSFFSSENDVGSAGKG